jgi:hypothetical protein
VRVRAGLLERGERRLDALALVFGYQAGKHLAEMRVLGARMDVLPAVGLEECGADRLQLRSPIGPSRSIPTRRGSVT